MATGTKVAGKKTREKLGPKQKRCCDCKQIKHKLKDFKPRWGRCEKHREQGKPFQAKCKGCVALVNGNIRQPRCIGCDAKRVKKEAPATAAPAKKTRKKKGTTVEVPPPAATATPPVTATAPGATVETVTPPAPEPVVTQSAPAPAPEPVAVGTPEVVTAPSDSLAAVAGLLDGPEGTGPF